MSIASNFPSSLPSLLLDFANVKRLDPRITFTRTTTATYYDGVTTAKAEENLFTYSQEFDNAAWSKTASTVTANSTTAPDGTSTADTLTETATTNYHSTYQTNISLAATSYTFSCFAKPNGRNEITLVMLSGSDTAYATYNVSTGSITVAATTSGSFSSASTTITASANGFYRVALTATAPSTSTATIAIELYNAARSYAGNGTSGVYLWGAQLEQRSSATAYTATTTQPITNYIPVLQTAAAGVARFDHNPTTGESLGLLIEEARTNLVTYSEQFDNAAWSKSQVSVYANDAVAPNGTVTADRIVESTANNVHDVTQVVSISGAVHTISCYLKCINTSRPRAALVCYDGGAGTTRINIVFDLAAGAIVQSGNGTGTITSVGNGWYRCTATSSVAIVSNAFVYIRNVDNSNNQIYAGDGWSGVFAWGCQFEQGSFATSYIPTTTASVTRNADAASMTGTNFSSWFNNGEGTVYAEAISSNIGSQNEGLATLYLNDSNLIGFGRKYAGGTTTNISGLVVTNGVTQAYIGQGTVAANNAYKCAFGYKFNDIGISLNAQSATTDTSATIPSSLSTLYIARTLYASEVLNGTIKKLAYYPIRVTNAQLQALTV